MIAAAGPVPVPVKGRIGVDNQDPEAVLPAFLDTVAAAGVRRVAIHARKAWLEGLSPKQNREIPPLDHGLAVRMKAVRPELWIVVNGGIAGLARRRVPRQRARRRDDRARRLSCAGGARGGRSRGSSAGRDRRWTAEAAVAGDAALHRGGARPRAPGCTRSCGTCSAPSGAARRAGLAAGAVGECAPGRGRGRSWSCARCGEVAPEPAAADSL